LTYQPVRSETHSQQSQRRQSSDRDRGGLMSLIPETMYSALEARAERDAGGLLVVAVRVWRVKLRRLVPGYRLTAARW